MGMDNFLGLSCLPVIVTCIDVLQVEPETAGYLFLMFLNL